MSKFVIGEKTSFDEYISTTKAGELYNPDGQIQIYIRNVTKARDISGFNSSEMEILYEKGSEFKVLNVMDHEGKYWILLEEC